ncbi:MAG: hypothetical protein ACHRXM_23420 [Isosphaerales bacterium]
MRNRWTFRADLDDCILEDRLLPVVSNLGLIVLTTGGYVMVIPYPGAYVSTSVAQMFGNGGPSTAPGVSGTLVSTSFFMTGTSGISSVQPGNITGFPSPGVSGVTSSTGGGSPTILVGSGANEATGPSIPVVSRATITNGALNPPPVIGVQSTGQSSPILPAGQSYRSPAPMPPFGVGLPNGQTSPPPSISPGTPYSPNPQNVGPPVLPFVPKGR